MPVCTACDQLRGRPSDALPHAALKPHPDPRGSGLDTHYLCEVCGATLNRRAIDDNADPIWELYAG